MCVCVCVSVCVCVCVCDRVNECIQHREGLDRYGIITCMKIEEVIVLAKGVSSLRSITHCRVCSNILLMLQP